MTTTIQVWFCFKYHIYPYIWRPSHFQGEKNLIVEEKSGFQKKNSRLASAVPRLEVPPLIFWYIWTLMQTVQPCGACINIPGWHTIGGISIFEPGFIGCANTIAGSRDCPSKSSMESWDTKGRLVCIQTYGKRTNLQKNSPAWSCMDPASVPWDPEPPAV